MYRRETTLSQKLSLFSQISVISLCKINETINFFLMRYMELIIDSLENLYYTIFVCEQKLSHCKNSFKWLQKKSDIFIKLFYFVVCEINGHIMKNHSCYKNFYNSLADERIFVPLLAIIYLFMRPWIIYIFVWTNINSICCCSKFQSYRSVGKYLGYFVCLLLFVSIFKLIYFDYLVIVYVMSYVTFYIIRDSINFIRLYQLT